MARFPDILRPYQEDEYARRERLLLFLMPAALAWLAVLRMNGGSLGILSASAAVFTGALLGCYRSRHTEPGLWMLAVLFGVPTLGVYLLVTVMQIRDAIQGRGPNPWVLAADVSCSTTLIAIAVRASWTVIRHNRGLSARP